MAANHPDKLIKFCSTDVAMQILLTKTLRWSSPGLFRDALELDHESQFNFDRTSMLSSVIKMSTAMIFSREFPKGDTPLINAIKRWREEKRFDAPDEAEGVLRELLSKMVDQRLIELAALHRAWIRFNRALRVCCFSNKFENVTSWQRFGDNHRGIAFRFNIDEDGSFGLPEMVEYSNSRPEITSLKEQINAILYAKIEDAEKRFQSHFTIKSPINKLEHEWRFFKNSDTTSTDVNTWFDQFPFETPELTGVCFGIKTSKDIKEAVSKVIKKEFRDAKIYQASLCKNRFDIEVERLQ